MFAWWGLRVRRDKVPTENYCQPESGAKNHTAAAGSCRLWTVVVTGLPMATRWATATRWAATQSLVEPHSPRDDDSYYRCLLLSPFLSFPPWWLARQSAPFLVLIIHFWRERFGTLRRGFGAPK
jgi:hypothetical protein